MENHRFVVSKRKEEELKRYKKYLNQSLIDRNSIQTFLRFYETKLKERHKAFTAKERIIAILAIKPTNPIIIACLLGLSTNEITYILNCLRVENHAIEIRQDIWVAVPGVLRDEWLKELNMQCQQKPPRGVHGFEVSSNHSPSTIANKIWSEIKQEWGAA